MSTPVADLAAERYVSLTTFKRDGTAVATPVWLAGDGATVVVSTFRETGKVKRVRHTPRVTMQPCDMRGRVRAGTAVVEGVAQIIEDPAEVDRITRSITRRYPVLGRVLPFIERLRGSRAGARVALRISTP